ncbi:MAG TPA: hypothetical protein PLO50_15680, partial [Nitrospira sp.]|nr:hypothetical protein [Nitrospira sp.]
MEHFAQPDFGHANVFLSLCNLLWALSLFWVENLGKSARYSRWKNTVAITLMQYNPDIVI